MNNIGGIIRVEIIPNLYVEKTERTREGVKIATEDEGAWLELPITVKQTKASASPLAGSMGPVYNHQLSTFVAESRMNEFLRNFLRIYCRLGVVARVTDANGSVRIYGSVDYPLKGTCEQTSGGSASALAGFSIALSARCLHAQEDYLGVLRPL